MIRITYDSEADAAYIYFRKRTSEDPKRLTKCLNDDLIADIGAKGEMTGLEVLRASHNLPKELLDQTEQLE